MLAHYVTGSVLALSLMFVTAKTMTSPTPDSGLGEGPCCSEQQACCAEQQPCCDEVTPCCVEQQPCCDEAKPCCMAEENHCGTDELGACLASGEGTGPMCSLNREIAKMDGQATAVADGTPGCCGGGSADCAADVCCEECAPGCPEAPACCEAAECCQATP